MTRIFKNSDKKKFANDHISKKSLRNLQKLLPPYVKKRILLEQKKNKIDVYALFNLLKFIYIGQHIRTYGLLLDDCHERFQSINGLIEILFELNLIECSRTKTKSFKNLNLITTTSYGKKNTSELLKYYLDNLGFNEIINKFEEFLLFYIYEKKIIEIDNSFRYYAGPKVGIYDIFFRGELNNIAEWSAPFYQKIQELFLLLKDEYNIAVKVTNYVSTGYGQKRQLKLLIPYEFINWLEDKIKNLNILHCRNLLKIIKLSAGRAYFFINFLRNYDIVDYNKALEYYSKDIEDLIKNQIYSLENNEIINLKESFIRNKNLLLPPFEIISQDAYLRTCGLQEQELITSLNDKISKLLSNVYLKDFEFPSEELSVESEEYKSLLTKHRWRIEKCPSCGTKISDIEQRFCEKCGKKL